MSSKNKAKGKNKCPGCGTSKDQHDFAVMDKQVGDLQIEQQALRDTVTEMKATKNEIGGGTPIQDASACSNISSSTQPEKHLKLAYTVAPAIQSQVLCSKPPKPALTLIFSTYFHALKLSTTHVAILLLEAEIGKPTLLTV